MLLSCFFLSLQACCSSIFRTAVLKSVSLPLMTTRDKLPTVGFPFPSEPKLLIFRPRIEAMFNRATQIPSDWELFSPQYQYKSFLRGGPKRTHSLSGRIENNLRSKDWKTTERYKNRQRERNNAEAKRWCQAARIEKEVVMDGLFLFYRVRTCAACLHSPFTVATICMVLAEEQLRKDEGVQEQFVYPPSKKRRMN